MKKMMIVMAMVVGLVMSGCQFSETDRIHWENNLNVTVQRIETISGNYGFRAHFKITNNSDKNVNIVLFTIIFLDKNGNEILTKQAGIENIAPGRSKYDYVIQTKFNPKAIHSWKYQIDKVV